MFGNPYKMEKQTQQERERVVNKYIIWFKEKLEEPEFKQGVQSLKNETIACWCVPKLCHGHVILYYLDQGEPPNSLSDLYDWGAPEKVEI